MNPSGEATVQLRTLDERRPTQMECLFRIASAEIALSEAGFGYDDVYPAIFRALQDAYATPESQPLVHPASRPYIEDLLTAHSAYEAGLLAISLGTPIVVARASYTSHNGARLFGHAALRVDWTNVSMQEATVEQLPSALLRHKANQGMMVLPSGVVLRDPQAYHRAAVGLCRQTGRLAVNVYSPGGSHGAAKHAFSAEVAFQFTLPT